MIGIALITLPLYSIFISGKVWKKILAVIILIVYGSVFYLFNFKFLADKMFYQPGHKILAPVTENNIDKNKLVIGIQLNGEAKAYPISIIGYHHQVKDTVGGQPVMVTYCTVCRTGRVFSPFVDGQYEKFRLVGMDHFNAMFEDERTKSWWRQATGEAITGALKGKFLKELPSEHMQLGAWIRKHPGTKILQADTVFNKRYEKLKDFDIGTIESHLEKRDSSSWQFKSWVVGVVADDVTKAYDWNDLIKQRLIQDSVGTIPILLMVENDSASFHVWNRIVEGQVLQFSLSNTSHTITDENTRSIWNMEGICVDGPLKGKMLATVRAYQEFWHSWLQFHPATLKKEYQADSNDKKKHRL